MDSGLEVMIFMGLVLKIPVLAAAWLIWHAIRSEPEPAEAGPDDGGNQPNHYRREPKRPRGPRRGPHAPGSMPVPCPEGEGRLRPARPPAGSPLREPLGDHHR